MWDLVSSLPPGAAASTTFLAKRKGEGRVVVLREVLEGSEAFWPEPSVPAVVRLLEMTELGGKRYAAFAWVPGVTLKEVVEALQAVGKHVPLGLVGRVVVDAARAVGAVVPARPHGGLSDAALLLGFDAVTHVLDFGAPRLGRFTAPGKPGFTADVFSLGAVLHSALTGFAGVYSEALADGLPLPLSSLLHPEGTKALDDVLVRALSRTADGRQPDVEQLADELEAVLEEVLLAPADVTTLLRAAFGDREASMKALEQGAPSAERPAPISEKTEPGGLKSPVVTAARPSAPRAPVEEEEEDATRPRVRVQGKAGEAPSAETVTRGRAPGGPADEVDDEAAELTRPRTRVPPPDEAARTSGRQKAHAPQPDPEESVPVSGRLPALVPPPEPEPLGALTSRQRPLRRPEPGEEEVPPRRPEARPLEDELDSTRPRIPLPVGSPSDVAQADTGPRHRAPAAPLDEVGHLETGPRLRRPEPLDEAPPPPAVTELTEEERRRALGQERIPTPNLGMKAVSAPEITATGVKPGGSRRAIALLLVLMAGGLVATALLKPEKLLALRLRLGLVKPPPPDEEVVVVEDEGVDGGEDLGAAAGGDAGEEPGAGVDDAGAAAARVDGGALAAAPDAGRPDAGARGAGVDAGAPDAGVKADDRGPRPVKRPVKKKRRWR